MRVLGVVEGEGVAGHAGLLERSGDFLADGGLVPCDAGDRQEAQQAFERGAVVDLEGGEAA